MSSIDLNNSFESANHEESEKDAGSNPVEVFSTSYDLEPESEKCHCCRNVTCCGNLLSWASKIFDDQRPIFVAIQFFVTNVVMIMADSLSDIVQFITYLL